ncbi:MAG: hypothetical protein WCJ11_11540 [Methylococcaceae bacterium]
MAKLFLDPTDTRYSVVNNNMSVYGAFGEQSIVISAGVNGITLDANVESVQFSSSISDYSFKQAGNRLNVYDFSGVLISKIGIQDDVNGTQLTFANGTVDVKFAPTAFSLGLTISGQIVSSTFPTSINLASSITPTTNNSTILVTSTGVGDASVGNVEFNVEPGDYTYTIANFANGDVLHFPAGNTPTVINSDYADGKINLMYASDDGTVIHIILTGLIGAANYIGSAADANTVFGAGSII